MLLHCGNSTYDRLPSFLIPTLGLFLLTHLPSSYEYNTQTPLLDTHGLTNTLEEPYYVRVSLACQQRCNQA
jgi:hypothetical protein